MTIKPRRTKNLKKWHFFIAFTDIFLSVITFTFSGLWLTGQVNDSSIGTHLETIWFKLVELDIIAVSVFVVVLVEFDKYYISEANPNIN